jgi:tetratricopeptide (TPR) repeat protein
MNPNNLGGFAASGVPIWLGILLREREVRTRAIAALAIVLCATTALFALSRGAVAVLFGGMALFAVLQRARSRAPRGERAAGRWRARLSIAAVLSAGIGIGSYIALDRLLRDFEQGDADKLTVIGRTLQFAARHPWLGVGRGAFASTYPARGDKLLYQHSENFFTQWAVDWGFPIATLLAIAIGHALWRAFHEDESRRRFGAIVGVICMAAWNFFDIGLELVGVAVVAAALLGATVAPTRTSTRSNPPARFAVGSFTLAAACAAGIALLLLAPSVARDSNYDWDAALRSRIDARDRTGFSALLQDAVRLHPVEPRFAILAAGEAIMHVDRRALSWINRGMKLAPGWTAPHVQAFQFLWHNGRRDQALLELRAAAEISPISAGKYVCSIAGLGSAAILRAAPSKHRGRRADFLEIASNCVVQDEAVSQELDRMLLSELPHNPAALEREAMRKARQGDLDGAVRQLEAVNTRHPQRVRGRVLKVEVLMTAERYEEAAASALESARALPTEQSEALWRMRAMALSALKDDAGSDEALGMLRSIASSDSKRLAATYALEGKLHVQRQRPGAALRSYKAAYRITEDSSYLHSYGQLSIQLGDRASALWAFMELCQRQPQKAKYCAKRDALLGQDRPLNLGARPRN